MGFALIFGGRRRGISPPFRSSCYACGGGWVRWWLWWCGCGDLWSGQRQTFLGSLVPFGARSGINRVQSMLI
ncbi:hypothetical protein RHMOL_Rhmol04G0337100 [Rhododendron molle]|uniref:Uncharacterized protein n=1 Tax=Rhododendron molle TaxID=49168 RepID=A0ACC0P8S6_RHOML|nr:hypothetical protein RHMOL_Rhmol04G0337100 [Rhododendron molle]